MLTNAQKEDTYGKACKDRQCDFCPIVYSADDMPGKGSHTSLLAAKWKREYTDVVKFVSVHMALAVVCLNSLLLQTERDKGVWKRRAPEVGAVCLSGHGMSNQ